MICKLEKKGNADHWCEKHDRYHAGHHLKFALGNDLASFMKRALWDEQAGIPAQVKQPLRYIAPPMLPPITVRPTSELLVICVAVEEEGAALHEVTGKSQRDYARRIGADYVVIDGPSLTPEWVMMDKFRVRPWLDHYRRYLYLDADVFIAATCPSLFALYPPGAMALFDDTGWNKPEWNYLAEVESVCKSQGLPIPKNYHLLNSGVVLFDHEHRDIWAMPSLPMPSHWCAEQHLEVIRMMNDGVPWVPLPRRFNWEYWIGRNFPDPEKHLAQIIHGAGYTGFGGTPAGRIKWLMDRIEEEKRGQPFFTIPEPMPTPPKPTRKRKLDMVRQCLFLGKPTRPIRPDCGPCGMLYSCDVHGEVPLTRCRDVCDDWVSKDEPPPPTDGKWWRGPTAWHRLHKLIDQEKTRLKAHPNPTGEGDGIVITGGGKYFDGAYCNIRLLRHHGCTLPIELWYFGRKNEMPPKWQVAVQPYNVRCIDADHVRTLHPMRILNGWEIKFFAVLWSAFRRVLFLDADCYPMRDPSFVFHDPRFLGAGAVFQRDCAGHEYIKPGVLELFKLPRKKIYDLETGAFLVDKQRWGLGLGMTVFLNSFSDIVYEVVYGDKTTPALASLLVNQPYAVPKHAPGGGGWGLMQKWFDGTDLWQHRIHSKPTLNKQRFTSNQNGMTPTAWNPEINRYLSELRKLL